LSFSCSRLRRAVSSFPTRRSSDLVREGEQERLRPEDLILHTGDNLLNRHRQKTIIVRMSSQSSSFLSLLVYSQPSSFIVSRAASQKSSYSFLGTNCSPSSDLRPVALAALRSCSFRALRSCASCMRAENTNRRSSVPFSAACRLTSSRSLAVSFTSKSCSICEN